MLKRIFGFSLFLCLLFPLVVSAGGEREATEEKPEAARAAQVKPSEYDEAPMLAELVKQGKLPPVGERLPTDPIVIKPRNGVGEYGGTMRTWWNKPERSWMTRNYFKYERMAKQKQDMSFELEPDLADWWQISDDKKEYTIHLREGLKWSDGHPYTTEDVEFYWNEVIRHPEIGSLVFGATDIPGELKVIDKYTFKITFPEPNGVFLVHDSMTTPQIYWHYHPKHYLKQFHGNYATEQELEARMKEAGVESWGLLYRAKANWMSNPELPQLSQFILEQPADETGYNVWVRNPYYYKVDTAGNQLPYIDRVSFEVISQHDIAIMGSIAGDFDYHMGNFRANHYPMLKQNEPKGPYRVGTNNNAKGGEFSLFLNHTTEDPVLRKLFNDLRFRQAISLSLNREEIVDTAFWGAAEARQLSPIKGSPVYDAEWEKSFADYDPDRANELLDGMGLTEKDKDGFRLRPDGKTLSIIFDWSTSRGWGDAYQLVSEYIQDVGIKVISRGSERSVYGQRAASNKAQMTTWSRIVDIQALNSYLPSHTSMGNWGYQWGLWFNTKGAQGEQPPADLLKVKELVDSARVASDTQEMVGALKEAGQILMNNVWMIGIMGNDIRPEVVHDRLKNVRFEAKPFATFLPTPSGSDATEQWWIDQSVAKSVK